MKVIYLGLVVLLGYSSMQAQSASKEVLDETKTVTTKTNNGKEVTESKVEINRRVEQDVKLDKDDKHKLNQNRVATEAQETIKITKNSPFTASNKSMTYELDGKSVEFEMNSEGFLISNPLNSKSMKVEQSAGDNSQFVMDYNGRTEIGFFDEKGNFIVQKIDDNSNQVITKTYILVQ